MRDRFFSSRLKSARFGHTAHIGLSPRGIAVLRSSWRGRPEQLAEHRLTEDAVAAPERLAPQLRTILSEAGCDGLPATIVLADEWVRLFIATPPQLAGRLLDCRASAAMRFQMLYGEPIDGWQLQADWDARHPFLACAVPLALLHALRQVAQECSLQLMSVAPHFIAAWNRWCNKLQAGAWFGVVNEHLLTVGMIDRQHLCAVRTATLPNDACNDPHWLNAYVARESLRMNLSLPQQIQLCGQVPDRWTMQVKDALPCTRLDTGQDGLAHDPRSSEVGLAWSGAYR